MKKPQTSPLEKNIHIEEGKTYRYKFRKDGSAVFHTECCACGLVHLEQYRVVGDYLTERVWVDNKKTETARKSKLSRLRRAR